MLLGAKFLTDIQSVNSFRNLQQPEFYAGDTQVVGIQLWDQQAGCGPAVPTFPGCAGEGGRRYVPAVGATLSVTLDSIDAARRLVKAATQPFPTQDPSIWTFTVLGSDPVIGTITVLLALTESGQVRHACLPAALRVRPSSG